MRKTNSIAMEVVLVQSAFLIFGAMLAGASDISGELLFNPPYRGYFKAVVNLTLSKEKEPFQNVEVDSSWPYKFSDALKPEGENKDIEIRTEVIESQTEYIQTPLIMERKAGRSLSGIRVPMRRKPDAYTTSVELGNKFRLEGNFREAEKFYNSAIVILPGEPRAYRAKAEAHTLQGDYTAVLATYNLLFENVNVEKLGPRRHYTALTERADAAITKANLERSKEGFSEALTYFEQAVEIKFNRTNTFRRWLDVLMKDVGYKTEGQFVNLLFTPSDPTERTPANLEKWSAFYSKLSTIVLKEHTSKADYLDKGKVLMQVKETKKFFGLP